MVQAVKHAFTQTNIIITGTCHFCHFPMKQLDVDVSPPASTIHQLTGKCLVIACKCTIFQAVQVLSFRHTNFHATGHF